LDCETAQQQQDTEDLRLAKSAERADKERALANAAHAHQMELDAAAHAARLKQKREEFALEEDHRNKDNMLQVAFLQQLKEQGVDLTKYLSSLNTKSDKIVRIETEGGDAGKANVHV
jgi:hypothetical protein